MKLRNGFVSNSSSSSFLVPGNMKDVASKMLALADADCIAWQQEIPEIARKFKRYRANLRKYPKYAMVVDGITFPSTNYDTYIIATQFSRCAVRTCNNIPWESLHYTTTDDMVDDLINLLVTKCIYYDLNTGLVLRYPVFKTIGCPNCGKTHYEHYLTPDNKIICALCFKEIICAPCVKEVPNGTRSTNAT